MLDLLPAGCVVDGEIVIATPQGLDFDALQLRLHPAQSRTAKLARETPASFVAFDLLAVGGDNIMATPQWDRRENLEKLLSLDAVRFANYAKHLRVENGRLHVSSLMQWYADDFKGVGGPAVYLSKHVGLARKKVRGKA